MACPSSLGSPGLTAEVCTWNTDVYPTLYHQTEIYQKSALGLIMIPHKLTAKLFSLKGREPSNKNQDIVPRECIIHQKLDTLIFPDIYKTRI